MNDKLPPTIIVELQDGTVISAELVKVVGDSIISVAHYRENGGKIFPAAKWKDNVLQNPEEISMAMQARKSPEQAALDHANWAVSKLHEVMGLKTPF